MAETPKYLLDYTGPITDHALALALEFEGRMDDIPTVAAETASDWLDEHLTNPSNPPVDTSFRVSGAAADSKTVGDKSFIYRGLLRATDDLFDPTLPQGEYFWGYSTNPANTPNPGHDGRGLLISAVTADLPRNNAVWLVAQANVLYVSVHVPSNSGSWGPWIRLDTACPTATKKILMPEGVINNNGKWAPNFNYCGKARSTLVRYNVENAVSVTVERTAKADDTLSVFQYSASGSLVSKTDKVAAADGAVTDKVDISSTTRTIALRLVNYTTSELPDGEITMTVIGRGDIPEEKNPSFGSNVVDDPGGTAYQTRWFRFSYKVGDMTGTNGLESVYNTGMMMLPPNYTVQGDPVPVIVMVHGSECYTHPVDGAQSEGYEPYYEFLNDCGYALIDCCGWTSRDSAAYGLSNPWPAPTSCKAYQKLIELMCSSFNLDRNNLFLLSKSNGGRMAEWLAGAMPNVRANCMLAPALDLSFGYAPVAYRHVMAPDMGLAGVVDSSLGWDTEQDCMDDFLANYRSWATDKREAFYLANEQQIMGWDEGTYHLTGATAVEMLKASAAKNYQKTEWARVAYAPTKIWYGEDDTVISPTLCATVCTQIRNGGGEGVVRPFPAGCGGHHAVDTSPNAPKVASVTTPLGYTHTDVPLAYYEAWEFMEQHRI